MRHELKAEDFARRVTFARWLLARLERNVNFLRDFIIGDEAIFCLNGKVNRHNVVEYVPIGHPPAFAYDVHMSREKLVVWMGLCGGNL